MHVPPGTRPESRLPNLVKNRVAMNRFCRLFLCIMLCGGLLFAAVAASADGTPVVEEKASAHPAKRWRAAYIEGGGYTDYQRILAATAKGLAELGIIADGDVPIPEKTDDTRPIWDWLAEHAGGDRLEFLKDGYYSANWDAPQRAANKKALLDRIRERGDVDMVFAFGTWAGLDMATADIAVPVFSMSVTDAVQAGISKSLEDSGRDNLHTQIDPERYKRQLAVFHDIFGFKKLGVPYEDTPEGRSDVSLAAIESAADELGIELVRCTTALNVPPDQSFANLRQCISQLAETSDAVYLTTNSGMQWNRMRELLQPLIKAGVPSFSQSGIEETKLGVLMSLSQSSFSSEGRFGAEAIAKVMDGTRPRDVGQVFDSAIGLAINLEMARLIYWDPPFEILLAADAIYQDIKNAGE